MGLTTVASVEAYTSDTSNTNQPAPDNYAEFSQQERVSVNLIDNDLWLVDSSQLNAQTIDEPPVTLMDWTTANQTNVSLDNTTADASPLSISAVAASGESNLLPSLNFSEGNLLRLPEVTGSLNLASATTPSSSSNSSGSLDGLSGSSTSGQSLSSSGSTNTSGSSSFSSQSTPGSSDASTAISSNSSPNSELPPDSSTSTSVSVPSESTPDASSSPPTSTTTSTSTSTSTSTPTASSPPNSSSIVPVPAPFDVSSTLGLAIVLGLWGGKQFIKRCMSERKFYRV